MHVYVCTYIDPFRSYTYTYSVCNIDFFKLMLTVVCILTFTTLHVDVSRAQIRFGLEWRHGGPDPDRR